MSIRFNHATNTMTSTNTTTISIEGGTPTLPRPLRLNASSIILPNKQLPTGEAGAVVFDITSKTLKYHNGFQWVELLSQDDILAPVNVQITNIYNQLAERVKSVTYSSSAVPSATVSGTNLNIVFPTSSSGGGTGGSGLFTSSLPGSIMYYSLISGQSAASIREQMSGVPNGQAGRNGSISAPFITKTGWCFGDGYYWTWIGENGPVTKYVPNLNQDAYIKSMNVNGVTKIDSVIAASGSVNNTTFNLPRHYHGVGAVYGDDSVLINGKTWADGYAYTGRVTWGDNHQQNAVIQVDGNSIRDAISTTYPIYDGGATTASITHSHTLSNVDVNHFNAAVLYNIAEPSLALNQTSGDIRYVMKTGDVMSGSLTIGGSAAIRGDDTNQILWFQSSSNIERAAIYHNSTTSTLRFRSNGGNEMTLSYTGILTVPSFVVSTQTATVGGRNIVRSINGSTANVNGDVTLTTTGVVTNVRLGSEIVTDRESLGHETFTYRTNPGCLVTGFYVGSTSGNEDEFRAMFSRPVQILIDGVWRTIDNV